MPNSPSQPQTVTSNRITVSTISEQLQNLYHQDFKDAYEFSTQGPSVEDHQWLERAESTIQRVPSGKKGAFSHQYQLELPFRDNANALKNNRRQAERQMSTLAKKFNSNPRLHDDYVKFMQKMESEDYVEEVEEDAINQEHGSIISYVPHHGVYHPKKNKIRVVFNCASKFQGLSLNDCLMPGPDLTSSLLGVLCRFRLGQVAFMADVESMFYRVLVPPHQRDALRYLWWPQGDCSKPLKTFRLKVHLFGASSSPSCANFALRQAAKDAVGVSPQARQTIFDNFYVDDCLKSVDCNSQAIALALDVVKACAQGGFRLTKFVSTSQALLQSLPSDELANDLRTVNLENGLSAAFSSLQERALGVAWNVSSDQFEFRIPAVDPNKGNDTCVITRRGVLSKLSSVYDPLGMAAPVVITARLLFRRLTSHKLSANSWDENLQGQELAEWTQWIQDLPELQRVKIPRWLGTTATLLEDGSWEIHAFCDASLEAYSAVVYLRQSKAPDPSHPQHRVAFVLGKARVAPPKVVTVPRLELVAAKLATELVATVERELHLRPQRTFWTDSHTVLRYLRNTTKRFHVFVANRLAAIGTASKVQEWRFVPTSDNPADVASRGTLASKLASSLWFRAQVSSNARAPTGQPTPAFPTKIGPPTQK